MGGSGSGGGSSSGTIAYPSYMTDQHDDWLDELDDLIDTLTAGASPFAGSEAYNPDADVTSLLAAVSSFDTNVSAISATSDFAAMIAQAVTSFDANNTDPTWVDVSTASETEIAATVAAEEDVLDDRLENTVLPRFRGGMRNINAVQTTAFTLGLAYLEADNTRQVNKFQGDLRMAVFLQSDKLEAEATLQKNKFNLALATDRTTKIVQLTDMLLRYNMSVYEFKKIVTHYTVEAYRIKIVAKKEESDANFLIDEKDAKWDLEAYQYGANMLAAISGGTVPNTAKQSSGNSMLGGALSGAATGGMIGGVPGAVIGGVLGAASGLF